MRKKKTRLRSLLCILTAICLILPLAAYAEEPLDAVTDSGALTADLTVEEPTKEEPPALEEITEGREENSSESQSEAENETSETDEKIDLPEIPTETADEELSGTEKPTETADENLSDTEEPDETEEAESRSAEKEMRLVSPPSVPRADESDEEVCMVLTGESFENARFSKDSNPTGAFNGKYGSYLLAQSGDLQDRKTESTVYIPTDGWYYVGARMKTARTNVTQASYYRNRSMQVSFTQNGDEYFVEGSKPWQAGCEYDFDSYEVCDGAIMRNVNVYLFGAGREFVSDLKSYNYTDAKPLFLRAGETTITLYGNSYARMDYLVVSKAPMEDIQTKSEYDSRYKRFENPGQIVFESEPSVSDSKELICLTNCSGCVVKELYLIDWANEHRLLLRTTDDSIDLSNLRYDMNLPLYVKVWNLHGYSVTSEIINYATAGIGAYIDDVNIYIDAQDRFRTTRAFTSGYPAFKPTRDVLCGDAYSSCDGEEYAYTVLNTPDGVPLKHTTRVFVPKSGTYYVRARVPSYYSDKRHDVKYGTFTLSFEQNGGEKFVQGRKPAENDSDLQSVGKFDSLLSGGNNKYLFGAMREFVSTYKGYAYHDAQPIHLEKGYADVNIYAYQGAAVDYIVISEHKPLTDVTEALFLYSDYCYRAAHLVNLGSTATGSFVNGRYSVVLPNRYVTGYGLYGVTANGKYENLGYAAGDDEKITTDALYNSSYRAVALVAYDDTGNYVEQRLPVSRSKVTYVITPNNTFEYDPADANSFPDSIWRRSINTPEYGYAFNRASGGDIMRTYEAIGQGPKWNDEVYHFALKTTVKIYVPHSGKYKISARTASASSDSTGAYEADRLFCVGVKQNNQIQGVSAYSDCITLSSYRTSDRFGGILYAYGISPGYGAEPAFYNYDNGLLLNLSAGEAEISLYGFGNVRLDYIAITDYDMQLPETKEEYDELLYPFEDINLPYLDGDPNIIRNEDGSYEIEAYAKDASGQSIAGIFVYECKGDKKTLIDGSDTDSVSCIAEISPNSEICIRAENSIGAYKEYFFSIDGLDNAQELIVGGEDTEGCFEFVRDSDYYRFTSSSFPTVYKVVCDQKDIYDFKVEVYKAENNTLTKLYQWQYGGSVCRMESPASAEPVTYLIRVSTGMDVGGYTLRVEQEAVNSENGYFSKEAVKDEYVFAYIAAKHWNGQQNETVTVEYDPYQLTLLNAFEGTRSNTVRPGTYGNIQITESSFGRISFKYLSRSPFDAAAGRVLNILKFISQIDGVVNLKFEYTNE